MDNFYFHCISYLDGLSVGVKEVILRDKKNAGIIWHMNSYKNIEDFFVSSGVKHNEAKYAAGRITDKEFRDRAEKEYKELGHINFIHYFHENYPEKLKNIYNPPLGLYVYGRLPEVKRPCVAVIGSRNSSDYGEKWAGIFTEELCKCGVQIISGMARGIDGVVGRIAVNYEGMSYAVLGSGIDVCYPESNRDLYISLRQNGSIISEYPPHTSAEPFRFPFRNRIISGLSDAVLVAEAALRSGSHITANFALEQGKDVFALPGNIDSKLSAGTNNLIKNGAYPALCPEDIIETIF